MAGEWQNVLLGEVCEINPDKLDTSWPHALIEYIDITSVGSGILNEAPRFVSVQEAPSRAQRLVRAGDTIVSTVRPNRRSFLYLRGPKPNTVVSTGFAVLRAKKGLEPRFLYYLIADEAFTEFLVARADGSAYPSVNASVFGDAEVAIPPLPEQRAIAHILGALDDKIELNRRTNETLESMARALFKSWFVDFGPVRAKAKGRDPGLPKPLADLFPASFDDTQPGEIPMGWAIGPILDHATLMSGGTPKTDRPEYWDGPIGWASAKDVSQSNGSFLVETERTITQHGLEQSATQMIPALCSVVVARGATTGRMVLFGREMAMNQTCYALATTTKTPFALYCRLREEIDALVHAAHGSVFDTITTSTFASSRVVLPPQPVLEAFENRITPVFQHVLRSTQESRTLAALRDALVPKLISGELCITDAERFIRGGE